MITLQKSKSKLAMDSWSSYGILITRSLGSGKTNALFNLPKQQNDINNKVILLIRFIYVLRVQMKQNMNMFEEHKEIN